MSGLRLEYRFRIVLLALLVLVAQASWGALSAASAPRLDAFGNPLCIGGEVHTANGMAVLPGCCELGCGASAIAIETSPASELTEQPELPVGRLLPARAAISPVRCWTSGYPRAPPTLA